MEHTQYPIIDIRSAGLAFVAASLVLPILWAILVLSGIPKETVFWILCAITLIGGLINLQQLIRKSRTKTFDAAASNLSSIATLDLIALSAKLRDAEKISEREAVDVILEPNEIHLLE